MLLNLFNGYQLSDGEKELISEAETPITAEISKMKIVADLYSVKLTERFVDKLITSNETLAQSQGRYARAMNYLTGALVFVGLVQVIVSIIGLTIAK